MGPARSSVFVLIVAVVGGACTLVPGGFDSAPDASVVSRATLRPGPRDATPRDGLSEQQGQGRLDGGWPEPPGVRGDPVQIGCADGSREGFPEVASWPDIAGCAGAWDMPGLLDVQARTPRCGRSAGDTGTNPLGIGCSVSDLCADGWHVCRDAPDVQRRSPTGCESAVPPADRRFFLVLAGASPQAVCYPDREAANDLHGCGGDQGLPAGVGCQPLNRRMGFAECQATNGIWTCGTAADHLVEARLVVKSSPALGGALCCRD